MKIKHIIILGIIFLILFGISLIQKAYDTKTPAGDHRGEVWNPFVPVNQVARIVFSKPKYAPVSLSRERDKWKVDSLSGAAADSLKINQVLEQINQMKAEWRAQGEEFYKRFGVGEEQAFRLQVFNTENNAMLDFYISAQRAGPGVFIRLPDNPKIYFVSEDLPALFGVYAEDLEEAAPLSIFFADLRLVPETFEQIQRFEVISFEQDSKNTLAVLDRESTIAGTPWEFVSDLGVFEPGFGKIENYVAKLIGAHGENIVQVSYPWKPEYEIMIRDERGKVLRLEFARDQETLRSGKVQRWLVKRESTPQIFAVSSLVVNDLIIDDASLVENNPLHIEINKNYSVELQDPIRTEMFSGESGWPSAAAILDAASRLRFLRKEQGVTANDLEGFPPSHRMKIKHLQLDVAELKFYASDPKLREIKVVITGQEVVYVVSRAFFETIFIPTEMPPESDLSENAQNNVSTLGTVSI